MNNPNDNEELNHAPLLNQLKGSNPYQVPDNYFESLAASVESKINSRSGAVVRPIGRRTTSLTRFVVAASVLIFTATAGFLYLKNLQNQNETIFINADMLSESVFFDDIDLSMLKEEASLLLSESSETKNLEDYLIENDFTYLIE
jgi:hypothetical protein